MLLQSVFFVVSFKNNALYLDRKQPFPFISFLKTRSPHTPLPITTHLRALGEERSRLCHQLGPRRDCCQTERESLLLKGTPTHCMTHTCTQTYTMACRQPHKHKPAVIHAPDMCLTPPIRAVPDLSLLHSAVK